MKTSRWLPLAIFGLVAVLLGAGVLLSRKPNRDALPSPLIGKQAPALDLPRLLQPDAHFDAAALRGAPYVLNVWGSWCPECRVEHPVLTQFAKRSRVRLIGYNLKDEPAEARRWLQEFGNPYADIVADEAGDTAINWGIYGAPETFVVDALGIVRWKHVGPLDQATVDGELMPVLAAAGGASP